MTRRAAILVAALSLIASMFTWAPALAATPDAVNDAVVVQKNAVGAALDVLANDTIVPAGTTLSPSTTRTPTPGSGGPTVPTLRSPRKGFEVSIEVSVMP